VPPQLSYKRANHDNLHVRGYRARGNINTPLELTILNAIGRFNLCLDVIDRLPKPKAAAAHVKDWLHNEIVNSLNYAYSEGIDRSEISNWTWPRTD
jgi:xylulose-5-phosphate/fructose-6-phosphate phosphoketolase